MLRLPSRRREKGPSQVLLGPLVRFTECAYPRQAGRRFQLMRIAALGSSGRPRKFLSPLQRRFGIKCFGSEPANELLFEDRPVRLTQ
jgi:hypothetical protein